MRQIYLIILLFCVSACAAAEPDSYPISEVERPLTLPAGMWEVGIGLVHGFSPQNNVRAPLETSLRYGITDDLELELLGLRYRFFHGEHLQTTVRAALRGIGQSTSGGAMVIIEGGVDAKYNYSPRAAMLYTLEERHYQYSALTDIVDVNLNVGPLFQLTEQSALLLNYEYRNISGTGNSRGTWLKTAFLWSLRANLDLKFEAASGSVQSSSDFSYSGNPNMYENTVGAQVRWRL